MLMLVVLFLANASNAVISLRNIEERQFNLCSLINCQNGSSHIFEKNLIYLMNHYILYQIKRRRMLFFK